MRILNALCCAVIRCALIRYDVMCCACCHVYRYRDIFVDVFVVEKVPKPNAGYICHHQSSYFLLNARDIQSPSIPCVISCTVTFPSPAPRNYPLTSTLCKITGTSVKSSPYLSLTGPPFLRPAAMCPAFRIPALPPKPCPASYP